jgi:glutamate dehydrogenase/leucine dehydrogenase
MTREDVDGRLNERMASTFEHVYDHFKQSGGSMRTAAMDIAVSRVVDGIVARGLLP